MKKLRNCKYVTKAGSIYWYKDSALHREDGAAAEKKNGWTSWNFIGAKVNPLMKNHLMLFHQNIEIGGKKI